MTARVALALVVDPPLLEAEAPLRPPDAERRVHNLGPAARVPAGEGRTFWVEGREVAVFRDRRRQVFAAQAWCPHHFGSLADGAVGYGEVTCPLHGLRFDLRNGAPRGHDCGGLRTYPIRVSRDGELLLTLD
jgi:nitrite reductase (NADH) small subunit